MTLTTEALIAQSIASSIALFGIFGNCLVVAAVKKKRALRSTTNYLLVNLAISDVITLVFAHFGALHGLMKLKNGILADILCKILISYNIPSTAIVSSIFIVTVIAVERYHAVVKPMRTGIRLRQETVKYAIAGIWFLALLITLPMYVVIYYDEKIVLCRYDYKNVKTAEEIYRILGLILIVCIPLLTITFCYFQIIYDLYIKNTVSPQNITAAEDVQNKRKMIKVAFYVTLSFLLCYLPAVVTTSLSVSGHSNMRSNSQIVVLSWFLFFLEPIINPVIYGFQSSNFKDAFKEILRIRCVRT